jgi:predicted Rossmann fold flavoprotein
MASFHRTSTETVDTLIIGAGAAGMMCAAYAGGTGGRVLVVDHARAPGEKIRISGGGRCNFTNIHARAQNFLSANPHFAKSALSRYTAQDFVALVARHGIVYHEKTLGQLFCDHSARDIIAMLVAEMDAVGAQLWLDTVVTRVEKVETGFSIALMRQGEERLVSCRHLVVACGGKSIPKMGASGYGYQLAEQFGLAVTETRPGLVPLTFGEDIMEGLRPLAGVASPARVACGKTSFDEALLFTHRGLSGPAILQISSYWREKTPITVTLVPEIDVLQSLRAKRAENGRQSVATALAALLPKRLAAHAIERSGITGNLADLGDRKLAVVADAVSAWSLQPTGSEGYRTAEVTLGGVDTAGLDSRTMAARSVPGLYFIGEVVDVTGWLGGYNFQWAWSSAVAAGRAITAA